MCEQYSGWTNKPTWLANLWITNDQGLHELFDEQAQTLDRYRLMELMKDTIEEVWPIPVTGLSADLHGWAFAHIEWGEIADGYLEEARIQRQRDRDNELL